LLVYITPLLRYAYHAGDAATTLLSLDAGAALLLK